MSGNQRNKPLFIMLLLIALFMIMVHLADKYLATFKMIILVLSVSLITSCGTQCKIIGNQTIYNESDGSVTVSGCLECKGSINDFQKIKLFNSKIINRK